mmetsp:Transcript_21773/g.33635  ORF Transcript_21773/g.33635 Transcript_21773/m.33635 type:complete len:105 (+) Transcript_21773:2842-3156(+)
MHRGFHFDSNKTSVVAHMNKNVQKQMFLNTARTDNKFFSNPDQSSREGVVKNSSDLNNKVSLHSKQAIMNMETLAKTAYMTPQTLQHAHHQNMSIESNSIDFGD